MKTTRLLLTFTLLLALAFYGVAQEKNTTNYGTHNDFEIDLGSNGYLEDGKSPDDNSAPYAVKPWGSWYVGLNSINDTHVGGAFHVLWGGGVSWYNFKFQNEAVRLVEMPDQLAFTEETGDFAPIKSKLTATYLNASLVPMLQFGDKRHQNDDCDWNHWDDTRGFSIGIGGYAGYKIASYAKYVTEVNGEKDKNKDKDGFFLNNFRYGARVQLGFRGMDVFVNYDLNELFAENKGPQLNAFSFGVVL